MNPARIKVRVYNYAINKNKNKKYENKADSTPTTENAHVGTRGGTRVVRRVGGGVEGR